MPFPLTVGMTPSFYYPGDWLLRAQLRCLSEQIVKDFDVLLIDSHYWKRATLVPEYAAHYKLNIVHVPYTPNLHVAKRLDCAIFNAPYCYSESPRIVRYSCWRFVTPEFTRTCLASTTNMDFRFHNCEPPNEAATYTETGHNKLIWDAESDVVHWDYVPTRHNQPGASWGEDSDRDQEPGLMPANCYGNYMIFRKDWLALNGCNEVFTNNEHWEDQDFCARARVAGIQCARTAHQMYRMHHWYGRFSGRANIEPDWGKFKRPCAACDVAQTIEKPNRYDIPGRLARGEIDLFDDEKIWVCKTCHLASAAYSTDESEATTNVTKRGISRATILPQYKLGRNLNILTGDMDGRTLGEKVCIYNRSWTNARYYQIH